MPATNPLHALAQQQKRDLHRLVSDTETATRAAFADAQGEVAPVLAQFADAYAAELARINADRDEEEEPQPRPVPLHWLISSGWGKRVEQALSSAAQKAGKRAYVRVLHAHENAASLGTEHARALMKLAMQPAVKAVAHRRGHGGRRRR